MLFLICWICLCILCASVFLQMSHVDPGEKRLLLAVGISLPFIFVRLIYSILGAFSNRRIFSPFTGSVTIWLCMAVLMEIVVVYTFIIIGATLKSGPRGEEPHLHSKIPQHPQELDNMTHEEHGGHHGTQHHGQQMESHPQRFGGRRRRGPIGMLIGLVTDRLRR